MVIFLAGTVPPPGGDALCSGKRHLQQGRQNPDKTNLEVLQVLRQKMKDSLLDNKSNTHEAIEQAQTTLEEAKAANKRISTPRLANQATQSGHWNRRVRAIRIRSAQEYQ